MEPCTGRLVIHHDGTLLYCTADLTDRRCADHTPARHATVIRCWSVMPHGLCGYCREVARLAARAEPLSSSHPTTKSA
jgi:hypothetical protein